MTYIQNYGEYTILGKGSIIFRGQTDAFDIQANKAILKRSVIDQDTYFGLDPESTTLNYGITTRVEINADIRLLPINNMTAYRKLRQLMQANGEIEALAALDRCFPVENGEIKRNSISKYDQMVLTFICNFTEEEGYIQPEMNKLRSEGGFMHSEIAICGKSVHKITQFLGSQAQPHAEGVTYAGLKTDETLRKLGQAMEQKRRDRKKPVSRFDMDDSGFKPLKSRRLFQDDE